MRNTTDIEQLYNSWFGMERELVETAGNVSFRSRTGTNIDIHETGSEGWLQNGLTNALIAVIKYVPTIGVSSQIGKGNSVLTAAASNLYSFVRYGQNARGAYEAQDLMIQQLSLMEAYKWLGQLQRLYGALRVHSSENGAFGRPLVEALGFNYSDMLGHIEDLRSYINVKIEEIATQNLNDAMPYIQRQLFLTRNVFMDAEYTRAQVYVFRPSVYYIYNQTKYTTGGCLEAKTFPSHLMQWNEIQTITDEIIGALNTSEDAKQMSGDILKAFGDSRIFRMDVMDKEFALPVGCSDLILNEINNIKMLPASWTNDATGEIDTSKLDLKNFDIKQADKGRILQDIASAAIAIEKYDISGACGDDGILLNTYEQDPSPMQVIGATRLTYLATITPEASGAKATLTINACGSELVHCIEIFYTNSTGLPSKEVIRDAVDFMLGTANILPVLRKFELASRFDWFPMLRLGQVLGENYNDYYINNHYTFFEVGNYTVLNRNQLGQMESAVMFNMFAVPALGTGFRPINKTSKGASNDKPSADSKPKDPKK